MSSSRYNRRNDRSDAPAAPTAPVIERPGPDIDARGKKDWSRYNATVVGAAWDLRAPLHPTCLPGLPAPPKTAYRPVSFAAEREYDEDEGWQKPKGRRMTKRFRERIRALQAGRDAVTLSID